MSLPPIKRRSPGPSIDASHGPIDSYLRTPFTAPKHRRAVHWEKKIPDSCKRDARGVDRARKNFILNLVRRLAEENKAVSTVRWLEDTATLDWMYDIGASERFRIEIEESKHSEFPYMCGIDYLDLTLHDIPRRRPSPAQQPETGLAQSAIGVNAHQRESYGEPHEWLGRDTSVHPSIHMPVKVELVNGEGLSMHDIEHMSDQMDIDTADAPPRIDLRSMPTSTSDDPYLHLPGLGPDEDTQEPITTYPLLPRNINQPRSCLDILASPGIEEGSEESSSEESTFLIGDHLIPVHPISGGGEWTMPSDCFQSHNHRLSPLGDSSSSSEPLIHVSKRIPSTSKFRRKITPLRRPDLFSSRSSVIAEKNHDTIPKGMKPPPRSSQRPNTATKPVLPKLQYRLMEHMPIILPKSPYTITRARRLLLPSNDSQPIAWVSLRGDAHWVDPERKFWKQDWSLSSIEGEDFCVGDVCRLDDETIVQTHLNGNYHFSVVTEHGGNIRPTRHHLVPVPTERQPGITSIIAATPTEFITGNQDHLIQLWNFRKQDQPPTIDEVGDPISGSHKSAISSMAMGQNDTLWSAAGKGLLGTDIRTSRTVFPLKTTASSEITQLHFCGGLLLLETLDLDHPFRLYDARCPLSHIELFGVANRRPPTSFQRGGWINTIFAHGLKTDSTTHDANEYVVLWELRNCKEPLQTIQLPNHTGMHCAFGKGGRDLIVTGNNHISFFTL